MLGLSHPKNKKGESVMTKKILIFFAVALLASCSGKTVEQAKQEEKKQGEEKVIKMEKDLLARIDDNVITEDEFIKEFKSLPVHIQAMLNSSEGKRKLLDNLIARRVLVSEAKRLKLDEEKEVQETFDQLKNNILIDTLLKREVEDKVQVKDKDLLNYYRAHEKEFVRPEMVRLRQIVVKGEKEAKEILESLRRGEKFEELARKHSVGPGKESGGLIAPMRTSDIPAEISKAVAELKNPGDISPVTKISQGYCILKLEERIPGQKIALESVKDELRERLLQKERMERFRKYIEELKGKRNIVINEKSLESISLPSTPLPKGRVNPHNE